MSSQAAPRRTLQDIERLERVPAARRLAAGSTYALLHKAVMSKPEQPAHCFLPLGDQSQPGEALTARAFLGKVHQSANLLADLGMGPQDVMALLLPDLLEKELLLWGGQAAGIVCSIPPSLLARPADRRAALFGEGESPGSASAGSRSRTVAEDGAGAPAGEGHRPDPAGAGTGQ